MDITKTFESASSSAVYTATLNTETGVSSCSCPAWRFKRGDKPRTCKHVVALDAPVPAEEVLVPSSAPDLSPIKPMLAVAMTKGGTFADFDGKPGWAMEEKLDGHRVISVVKNHTVSAWSRPRAGKVALARTLPPAILAAVATLPDGIYDGELMTASTTIHASRRRGEVYIVFDILETMGKRITALSYADRRKVLAVALEFYTPTGPAKIEMPHSGPCDETTLARIFESGGEGAILKRTAAPYQAGKRSPDWVKIKSAGAMTFTIIGYEAGKCGPHSKVVLAKPGEAVQFTTCKTKNNATLDAMAKNPKSFIGKRLVVSFTEKTDDGKLRHGVWDHLAAAGE